jgi:HD-like signal output (HDOD) protein
VPTALKDFQLIQHTELDAARKQALVAELRNMPRPPTSLHQLISLKFVTEATSAELSHLVMGEPLIAAKVLANVNAGFYGLPRKVTSIGQAVTLLGFNTVRSIGLQYMLNNALKADNPALDRIFRTIWASRALASELCSKLAKKLDLPDQGALVSHMVLYFIGHLATYSLMPAHAEAFEVQPDLLERTQSQQTELGVGASEIGCLLMQEWGLPSSIIDDVRDIDHILLTPLGSWDNRRSTRLALCYLCARLGERLAQGTLSDLATFDITAEDDLDLFHLRAYLQAPVLSGLMEHLHAPELAQSMALMQESVRLLRPT